MVGGFSGVDGRCGHSGSSGPGGLIPCPPSALIADAEPLGRASGLVVRFSSKSIDDDRSVIMCGRRGKPTVSYQKLSEAGAESCLREADVPEFQGFGIFTPSI